VKAQILCIYDTECAFNNVFSEANAMRFFREVTADSHSMIVCFVSIPSFDTIIAAKMLREDMNTITKRMLPVIPMIKLVKYGAIIPAARAMTPDVPFPSARISVGYNSGV